MGLKILNSEKSRFCEDGARTSGSVRATFPKVKAAGCEKTDVVKYLLSRWETGLIRRDPVDLPPADQRVHRAVPVLTQRFAAAHRQLVSAADHQPPRPVV